MAVTISKIQIPELDYIENYLDDSDEFVVFDNREVGTSKARKVTYQDIKDNFINPTGEGHEIDINNGIDYNFPDENTLRIIRHRYVLTDAYKDENSGNYVHGYMSAADKQTLDQLKETDMGKLNTSFNASVRTDNTTNTFTPFNIQSIQGVGAVSTRVEPSEQNGNILKISVDNVSPSTTVRSSMIYEGQELPLDFLQAGNGVSVTKETRETSTGSKNLFKFNIDTQALIEAGLEVDTSIKAEINDEEKTITKLIAGENVSFSENEEGQLTISSEGGSGEITPTPIDVVTKNKVFICNNSKTEDVKIISEEIETDEIFTVFFTYGFSSGNSKTTIYLKAGEENQKPIYYNMMPFDLSLINNYATFRKMDSYYSVLYTDISAGRGIKRTENKGNGKEDLILYDDTRISILNNLEDSPIVQLNYNNKIENDYLDIFDSNNKIKSILLPTSEGGGASNIGWPMGIASISPTDSNTYNVALPNYIPMEGNLVAIKFPVNMPIATNFSLNINNKGAVPVAYQGLKDFNASIFDNADTALFIYSSSNTGENCYHLLSVDAIIGDSISLSNNSTYYLTTLTQRKGGISNSINLINSNFLGANNKVALDALPDDLVSTSDLASYSTTVEIQEMLPTFPSITSESPITIEENTNYNNINIKLNTYQNYDSTQSDYRENADELYLNSLGQWSSININENDIMTSTFIDQLIDQIYPVGTAYYTTDPNFRPTGTGEVLPEGSTIKSWGGSSNQYKWVGDSFQENGKTIYRWIKQRNTYSP